MDGASAFEIGNICGTCEFWFRRLEAEVRPVEIESVQQRLNEGFEKIDAEVIEAFGSIIEPGAYEVALFNAMLRRVQFGDETDYFSHEQRAAWPDMAEDELNDPGVVYYRVVGRARSALNSQGDRAFEFVVPLISNSQLDAARIEAFEGMLGHGSRPTAVAVGVLDIKQHYGSSTAHWCLTHYILDGHHKVEAAARTGEPISILSFVARERGVASPEAVARWFAGVPTAKDRPAAATPA